MKLTVDIHVPGLSHEHVMVLVTEGVKAMMEVARDTKIYEGEAIFEVKPAETHLAVHDAYTGKILGVCTSQEEAQRVRQQAIDTKVAADEHLSIQPMDTDSFYENLVPRPIVVEANAT